MTSQHERVLKYIQRGIDDRLIIMELLKLIENQEFQLKVKKLIALQVPTDEKVDLNNKLLRLVAKGEALDEHLKINSEDKERILEMVDLHLKTLEKITVELKRIGVLPE